MLKILLIIAILVVSNTNAGRNRKGRAQPQKTKTINVPEIKLNDGCDIPMVGMGTWQGAVGYSDDTEMARIITDAIETGYRHIDTASIYGTERGTGIAVKEAIAKNRVKRSDMFITSKVWNNMQSRSSVVESIKNSLKVLDMTYLDLALIHYPTGFKEGAGNYPKFANGSIIPRKWDKDSYLEAWKGMEDAFKLGLAKSIGVSNFNTKQLKKLVESAEIKPSVNQVESHPNLNQRHLLNFCRKNNVLMEAYAPIRQADKELLNDPVLKEIAAKHNKTAAQVAFRWQIQRGVIVIPKTSKKSRMLENIDVFDFTISDSDMRKINAMKQKKRIYDIPGNQNHPDYPFNSADFLIDDNNAEEKIYASVCDKITFVTRAQWNARKAEIVIPTMTTPVHHVFIHHTEAPDQCHNQSACITAVKGIQNFHIDTRKWSDIGYNFLMGGDERIYEGRGWTEVGAHTLGMNDKSVALSLIGNFEAVDPPKFMLDLAQNWIVCGIEMGIIAKDYELHGHRDQTCTSCPGQHLYDIIKHWKQFKGGKLSTYVCNK